MPKTTNPTTTPGRRPRVTTEDALMFRMNNLRVQWNAIQNRANLRETRRLQRHGRYTKAERQQLDQLLTEMEAIKADLALAAAPTTTAVQ